MPAASSDRRALHLDLDAPATPDHLDRVHDRLVRFLVDAGVGEADRLRFETAVVELVGNVVRHARPRRVGTPVQLCVRVTRDLGAGELRAVLVDDALPVAVDLRPATARDDAESGRGLALIRAFCDDLTHEVSDTGNQWSLRARSAS